MRKNVKRIATAIICAVLIAGIVLSSVAVFASPGIAITPDNTIEMEQRQNMLGRLFVPDLGINVAVFNTDLYPYTQAQALMDQEDSACFTRYGNVVLMGDHNYQGFIVIQDAIPGDTIMTFQKGASFKNYICTEVGTGINATSHAFDKNGQKFYLRDPGTVVLCTCKDNSGSIYYAVFTPVDDAPTLF